MKKVCLALLLSVFTMFGFLSVSYSSTHSNPVEYMFTMPVNDSNTPRTVIEKEINEWFLDKKITREEETQLDFYSKIKAPDLTYGDGKLSGAWSTDDPIEFYSVKAGNKFAFYWVGVEGGSKNGTWTTEELKNGGGNIPALSRLSSWNPSPPIPNPEPTTILLFGFGLLGLAGVSRKKQK